MEVVILVGDRCLGVRPAFPLAMEDPKCLVSESSRGVFVPDGKGLSAGVSGFIVSLKRTD